jgi:hypothetical protein
MTKVCPITGKHIARRHAVHTSVLTDSLKTGLVIKNPNPGTLRQYVYAPSIQRRGLSR